MNTKQEISIVLFNTNDVNKIIPILEKENISYEVRHTTEHIYNSKGK